MQGVLWWPQLAIQQFLYSYAKLFPRWFRVRNLTLELIVGHLSGPMDFKNSQLNIEKVNPL